MSDKDLNEDASDAAYWDRADQIIKLVNSQCDNEDNDKVASSLLYASARFSAFIVASMTNNVEEMKQDRDAAIKHFTEQFNSKLTENIDSYIENYEDFIQKFRKF
ncbi:MAG: DUF3144 domain-containing protein [Gammaproteobacteria bacterium]|nr:DUF3144 domain-containing protein [Gammaproteobacteria bacterium]